MNVHKDLQTEQLYSCSQCEKQFANRHHLRRHMNLHSGKNQCTECGKCYENNEALKLHKRRHSGKNCLNVITTTKDLQLQEDLICMAKFTVEKNHTHVFCAMRHLASLDI